MKNIEFKKKIMELPFIKKFNEWNLKYKLMFIFGILMAIMNLSSLIVYFWWSIESTTNKLQNDVNINWTEWSKEFKAYRPDALALMWSNTLTFTMISNWILTINLILLPFFQNSQKAKAMFFTANVIITITFSIYWTLIFPTYFSGKNAVLEKPFLVFYSTLLHAINPIIGFIFMGLIRKEITLKTSQVWMTNIFVICYFMFALVTFYIGKKLGTIVQNTFPNENVNKSFHITIYDFLNFDNPLFYGIGWSKGTVNKFVVVILDILMFVIAVFLVPGIAYAWKASLRIKTYDKNNVVYNKNIVENN